ncbi:hypothetical protein Tco_1122553 [Tanacetum coccineum]|uniref:Uncharacterized protein n=1 Tax=Tanacetum coccineum TaxID=301880 RepID=A0ABQ5J3U4_9ASTR
MHTVHGDGVAGIKRRCRDLSGDGIRNLATALGRGRLKEDLESSTWRRHLEAINYTSKEERRKKEPRIRKEKKNREIGMNRRKKKEERIEEKGKEENRRKKEEQN